MQGPVCHDGCYKRIGEQFVLLMQRVCQDCQHVVAVNQLTSLIHQDHAVSVTIKSDSKAGLVFGKQGSQGFGLGAGIL